MPNLEFVCLYRRETNWVLDIFDPITEFYIRKGYKSQETKNWVLGILAQFLNSNLGVNLGCLLSIFFVAS